MFIESSVVVAQKLRRALILSGAVMACSSDPTAATSPSNEGGPTAPIPAGDDGAVREPTEPGEGKELVDGGYRGPDGSVIRGDRFVTKVVRATYGDCAGFGLTSMPTIVLGPPVGAGALAGSLDVVSLGFNGEIVLSFEPNAIVDGPGADFIVFENAFWVGGDPKRPAADLGEVSVSDDGIVWKTFPCPHDTGPPYGTCAGWRPVYSSPSNGISPIDPSTAGGDAFDLRDVGIARARFVRVRDLGTVACPADPARKTTTNGFDLDAIAIVNAETP